MQTEANPPADSNKSITITPTTRNFGVNGGGNAIITSGSGTWTASKSEDWITLNATSGSAGYPVAYTVSATTNVEQRIGYVYVSGNTHTVTQDGVGGTISPGNREFESNGGSGTISVSTQNKMLWHAKSNADWISVSATSGLGPGSVTYQVAPYNEVSTRQGTLTVAGNTFTVFQYGSRMKLDSYSTTQNYETHVIPITVNALAIKEWSVTPNNSWISIVDAGNGHGGDLVTIAIGENPSYLARTGTVTIGTETFTVTQQGRPKEALSFSISPTASTASVEGANAIITVTATPDLPWTARSGANWCSIYAATASGAGNGNIVYSASPNPTLSMRTGTITVTPSGGLSSKTHTVTQPGATALISSSGYEFEAAGESCSVEVSVANIVQWSVSESLDWLTVNGSTSRTGPDTVVLQAAANDTIYPRSGTVTIAGKKFSVSQKARGVEVEYDTKLFGTDGGYESISIHPDGNVSWTAVASDPTWITIFQGDSGTGDGEILYIVAPYVGDGSVRTGWITVGDKKVYITQRAYALSIRPNGSAVKGNNGAGEFGVSANIGSVWTAIVTEPWITLVSGYDAGTGSGTVRFICDDNNTGKPRVGKIVVAGEVYTVTQSARILVQIQAEAGRGGSITGAGTYDKGEKIVLTAVPDDGYRFVRWTGPISSTANPLTMNADEMTGIRAEFKPLPIEFTEAKSTLDGVALAWNTLAWATTYRLYRGTSNNISTADTLATLAGGTDAYRDVTGERGVMYWYWVEAVGVEDDVVSGPVSRMKRPIVNSPITYTNLRGATHSNPGTYVEGRTVAFTQPSAVTGYAFAGWTPSRITEDMTGAQTVWAMWTANRYSISYNANGGSGAMNATPATYDCEVEVAANGFIRTGHSFAGWATNATGAVVFAAGQPVTNLTDVADAQLTFYAVWNVNQYMVTFNANGGEGGKTVTQNYGTALAAPTVTRAGYTFAGWSPVVPATVPADNVTYTAQWRANKYTVTFDGNGGTGGWSRSMDYGAAISPPTVTRTGYTFTDWSPLVATTVPIDGATYTAQWRVNRYTVTFNANGGEGGKTVTQNYGTALAAPTVTRAGYTFAGWSPVVPATVPAGNATYVAQWEKNKYIVTFDANGSGPGNGQYMVVDLSGGSSATSYPVSYLDDVPAGGWSDEYKKTKLVMRRIPAGSFMMGDRWDRSKAPIHHVTLSKDFYIGVFEVTQKQWELVMGSNPSWFSWDADSDSRPVEMVSYEMIRGQTIGAGWPQNSNVDEGSFLAVVRAKADLDNLDLPTSAQWEYACRAETTTDLNTGDYLESSSTDSSLDGVGWYVGNSSGCTHEVGLCEANNWGLYDMHGNVWEWCLDWYEDDQASAPAIDPVGGPAALSSTWPMRVLRGGSYNRDAVECQSGHYNGYGCYRDRHLVGDFGFRLAMTAGQNVTSEGMVVEVEYGEEIGELPSPVRTGYMFEGWFTSADGGTKIEDSTKVAGNVTYYAHWRLKPNCYQVRFHKNDGSDDVTAEQGVAANVSTRLTSIAKLGWAKRGLDFVGWGKYPNSTIVWKSNWENVTDLANAGETVDLYAMWAVKPGSYAIEFVRNDGAGTWRTVGFNYGEKTRMPSVANGLKWARRGYEFKGWALTTADAAAARVWKGDWAYLSSPVKAGQILTVYAVWELKPGYYQIRFNKNDGTGRWRTLGFQLGASTKLSTIAGLGWERPGYKFVGWASNAANADAGKVWKTDGEWIKNAAAEGRTLSIYAIWE